MRYSAEIFIDASGKGAVARPAGAEIRTGREGKSAYNESLAPDAPDEVHHGHTVLYHLHEAPNPVEFPEVPWALEVARDFGNLNGQLAALGKDNQYGPDHRTASEQKEDEADGKSARPRSELLEVSPLPDGGYYRFLPRYPLLGVWSDIGSLL